MNNTAHGFLITVVLVALSGCSQVAVELGGASHRTAVSGAALQGGDSTLLTLISDARIGATQTHVDPITGLASTVRVVSEYFSANGRSCRRFTQHFSNAAAPENKLACRARDGWQEVPVASIVE